MKIRFLRMEPLTDRVVDSVNKVIPDDVTLEDILDSVDNVFKQKSDEVSSAATSAIGGNIFVAVRTHSDAVFKSFILEVRKDLLE